MIPLHNDLRSTAARSGVNEAPSPTGSPARPTGQESTEGRSGSIRFTVIELAIALFVIIFGFNGVVALISSGLQSKSRAVGEAGSADAVVQFLDLATNEIHSDWSWNKAIPTTKPTLDDTYVGWSENAVFQSGDLRVDFITDVLTATFDPLVHQDGVFRIRQSSGGGIEEVTSIVRAWREPGADYTDYSGTVTLHAEISWPANVSYAKRSTEMFSLQVYKAPVIDIATADQSGGISTQASDPGVVVQVTEVVQGSRIVNMTVNSAKSLSGTMSRLFIECPHSALTSYSNSGSFPMEAGYSNGKEGLLISDVNLPAGEPFSLTYKLALDYVPDTTVIATTALTSGTANTPLFFTQQNFDYVYTATQSTSNFIGFPSSTGEKVSETAGTVNIPITLSLPQNTTLSSDVTVRLLAVSGGTASKSDYSFTTVSNGQQIQIGTATFPQGSPSGTTKNAQIALVDDSAYETDETLLLTLTVVTGTARIYGTQSLYTLEISSDEGLPPPEDDPGGEEEGCTDTLTNDAVSEDDCLVVFGIDYIQIMNKLNYPVHKIRFRYLGEKKWDADVTSVLIINNGSFTKIFGKDNQKIDRIGFSREPIKNKGWANVYSDVEFCP